MDLTDIKQLRKKLGLTQAELAIRSGVSQSLIAKIESKNIDPSYSNAQKIIETLQIMTNKAEKTAGQIMHKKIIFLKHDEALKSAISIMRKHNISQLPIKKDSKVIGFISESILIDKILEGAYATVEDVMEPSPPILPLNSTQSAIASLLKYFPLILIENEGEIVGIITKSDFLKALYR